MSSRKKARGSGALRPENEPAWLDTPEVELFGGPLKADTKIIQLCRQVVEAISYALVCSTSPILRDLYVMSVEPARGTALLRVLVTMEGEAHDYQQPPAMDIPGMDLLVFPESLEWTMVYTHEDYIGPFFALAPEA